MTAFTTRADLAADQTAHPPYGARLVEPLERCVQVSSTAGTTGRPVHVLHTPEDVERRARLWQVAFEANGVHARDRAVLRGGAWACQAALRQLGVLCIAAADEHPARVRQVVEHQATVVVCTPSDALRLSQAALAQRLELVDSAVRLVVVTGEPGGHVASTRRRIEEQFGARCVDVYGLAELGVVGWDCLAQDEAIHLNEDEFEIEVDESELVVTPRAESAMRMGRYRTGDVVSLTEADGPCVCGRSLVRAVGGVPGRVEERLQVRGVEMLPSSVENIVRRHPAVSEYLLEAYHVQGECRLAIEIEPDEAVASEGDRARVAAEVAEDVRRSLGIRLQCEAVPPLSLSRAESRPRRLRVRS